jgi:hypothetical protein
MLRMLLILVMLSFQPIPRHTASNTAQASTQPEAKSKIGDATSTAFVTLPRQGDSDKPATQGREEKKSENHVTVFVPEPLKIDSTKDWRDNTTWIFGFVLTIFTGLQVWYLRKTLIVVADQAKIMSAQSIILTQSVDAAEKSAQAAFSQIEMMKAKERARLSIEVDDFEIEGIPQVSFKIMCYGTTPAYIVSSWEFSHISPIPDYGWDKEAFGFSVRNLPSVNPNGTIESESIIMDTDLHGGNTLDNPPEIAKEIKTKIADGDLYVHFRVRICYRDIFDSERTHNIEVSKIYGIERKPQPDGLGRMIYPMLTEDELLRLPEWHDSRYKYGEE